MGVIAIVVVFVALLGLALAALGFVATRRSSGALATRMGRWLGAGGPGVIVFGIVSPKRFLQAIDFEVSGRAIVIAAAALGLAAAVMALARRERGAVALLLGHLYFLAVGVTKLGEIVFGAFKML